MAALLAQPTALSTGLTRCFTQLYPQAVRNLFLRLNHWSLEPQLKGFVLDGCGA